MIKTSVTPSAYTSGNIPLTLVANTNPKYALTNNAIEVLASGITEVKANVTVTATSAGTITLTAYADSTPIGSATGQFASGDTNTLHINDIVRTAYAPVSTFAMITFVLSGACTLVNGDAICEYVYG